MDTTKMTLEQISAFVDGELPASHVDLVLASLCNADKRREWELYHQIGDVMRSEDMAVDFSKNFATRMSARLDAEPTIISPAISGLNKQTSQFFQRSVARKIMAAAAVAIGAFILTPQLFLTEGGQAISTADSTANYNSKVENIAVQKVSAPEGTVLRDPRIDDYLLAHQRFSPFVYSTAPYARAATFSNK